MNNNDLELDPEEQDWMNKRQAAKARQTLIHAQTQGGKHPAALHDEEIKRQMELDRAAVRAAAITPGALTGDAGANPFDAESIFEAEARKTPGAVNTPTPGAPQAAAPVRQGPAVIAFWTCACNSGKLYAESWEDLKRQVQASPGEWVAHQHEFLPTPKNLIAFFTSDGLPGSIKTTYEIIVTDGGKVFRADT